MLCVEKTQPVYHFYNEKLCHGFDIMLLLGAVQKPRDRGEGEVCRIFNMVIFGLEGGRRHPLQIECLTVIKENQNTGM